ncbi:Uncharacterised protein [Klebsiella pneumoniae]|nr:Uncharacterised protein [Klebsiella pneumoniae]VGB89980.1 Uncharacterised protein [Klebsiella pneumoniae]HBY2235306.1 hypothetical protein [Klebsiella pneumoniae]
MSNRPGGIKSLRATAQRTAAASFTVAERKAEVTKGASDVQQTVSHMPADDVDRELGEHFTRPASRYKAPSN